MMRFGDSDPTPAVPIDAKTVRVIWDERLRRTECNARLGLQLGGAAMLISIAMAIVMAVR